MADANESDMNCVEVLIGRDADDFLPHHADIFHAVANVLSLLHGNVQTETLVHSIGDKGPARIQVLFHSRHIAL